MATNVNAPATAGVQQTSGDQPSVVKDAREATGSVIKGPAKLPSEVQAPSQGVILEGLGNLGVPTEETPADDPLGGEGEYVVVLHEYVAGSTRGYGKGEVRRISNLLSGYGNPDRLGETRANAKRLFDLGAIRLATSDEQGKGHVEVGLESDELAQERMKRISLERELEDLRKTQSLDRDATIPLTKGSKGEVPNTESNWQ
jgi:hypothetical protein